MKRKRTLLHTTPRPQPNRVDTCSKEVQELERRLAETEAELQFCRAKQKWLQSALVTQRHARQVLEAGLSVSYTDTVARIREVVRLVVPAEATVLVVSKGDQKLLELDGRLAWHFPQDADGKYAGYYPSDSSAAIAQLKSAIEKRAGFLLFPNTAFWWLEHYRELETWLKTTQTLLWRDERCAIFKLRSKESPAPRAQGVPENSSFAAKDRKFNASALPRGTLPTILCFPIIDWDFRFQRPQQLMTRFATAGHRVFYLSHQLRKSGNPYELRTLAPSLWEVSLRGPRFSAKQGLLDREHCEELFESFTRLREGCLDVTDPVVALVHSPFWWPVVKEVANAFSWPVVYDCLDHHAGFSASNPILIEQERDLLSRAALVIASSAFLEAQARRYNHNVILVPNGCDYEHFAAVKHKLRRGRPVIGYYGAIAEWFDSDLVADLAESRPDWDFILVGSTLLGDINRLAKLANVHLTGEKPYAEIPDWLAKFNVAILPFKRTTLTEAANPVKAYEILASGKPLVSVPLPEVAPLAPLARLASDVAQFEREIEAALCETDEDWGHSRREFARGNTWQHRFEKFCGAVRALVFTAASCEQSYVEPTSASDYAPLHSIL